MTDTRITVDVSTEALLQRARQQQAQSRQAVIQQEEEKREKARQQREAQKAGRGGVPGQSRLQGRSRAPQTGSKRREVAAGYVVDQILCIALYPRTSGLTITPTAEGVPYAFFTPETIAGWWKLFNAKHHSSRRIVAYMDTVPFDEDDPSQTFFDGNFENSRIYMTTQFGIIGPGFVVPSGDLFIDFPAPYARLKRFSNDPKYTPGAETNPGYSDALIEQVLAKELAGVRKIIMTAFRPGETEPVEWSENTSVAKFVRWCADNKKILRGCEYKDLSGYTTGSGTGAYNYINCFDRPFSSYPLLLPPVS